MIQLMFNDNFDKLINEPINYWKTMEDVPIPIKEFIKNTSDSRAIYDKNTNKYYCQKCLKEIDKNNICINCSKKYIIKDYNKHKSIVCNIKEIKNYQDNVNYYVFDINNNNVLIYIFKEDITYNNPLTRYTYKNSKTQIKKVYQVLSDKVIDIKNNKILSYDKLEQSIKSIYYYDELINPNFDDEIYTSFEENESDISFLYTQNLNILKDNNLYKYTNIWDLKEYLSINYFNLSTLTYYPIYCKEFEYLVRMGLYNLATNHPYLIKYNKNFKNTFGVEKQYYEFMKKININYYQLEALKIYPTTNKTILDFISNNIYINKYLSKYIQFDKLIEYFKEQKLNENNVSEYYDYIRCCKELKLNLNDNSVLFPQNFTLAHDKITTEIVITENPHINKEIKKISSISVLNKYEDDKYIIFPAEDIRSLIDESSQQSNCVRTYCQMASNNECQIYFMRDKTNINKSLVTIEVRKGKIIQAKTKYNEEPSEEIKIILKKWEKDIIPLIKR